MKRSATTPKAAPKAKKPRPEVPDYHLTPSLRDDDGKIIWPAPKDKMEEARRVIAECGKANKKALICPDKDADGLSSGVILHRTLTLLGLAPDLISIHFPAKGNNLHDDVERQRMTAVSPSYIFVLDQGSRHSPPLVPSPHQALVIDHHYAASPSDFPEGAKFVTACSSPPVATSSLLTYELCLPLHEDMSACLKKYTKKALNDAVSLLNAPRRTSTYDVASAWSALLASSTPSELLTNRRLLAARAEVNAEVERCTHTAPKFSIDGRIAVFRINSPAQVHPVIATRWAGHLQSKKLEIVLCANEGYRDDGMINFSCRVARCAKDRDPPVNIIETLKAVAQAAERGDLLERLGESFARGHKEASGGIVPAEEFEELMRALRVGEKPEKEGDTEVKKAKKETGSPQKNTLMNYFGKKAA
ncbi:hypothetical protein H2199_005215 [Coniosporium tulheliwenetii]|uniref:Uncharacterized protein n=1 Tax=Coniosporium tulheliwenetii TaxID=3383036 RepID=A0ACC2Z466_9PEZI|nr:hypothetical protein H2199_005215 [Cladosporium sp. JES 115]